MIARTDEMKNSSGNFTPENTTTDCRDVELFEEISNRILYGVSLVLFVIAVYLFCVIVVYVYMNGFRESSPRMRTVRTGSSRRTGRQRHHPNRWRKIYRALMFSLCISVAGVQLVQFSLQQVIAFYVTCEQSQAANVALKYIYGSQIVFGYLFMWVRQRLFYYGSSPLRNLHGRKTPLVALSSLSLVFVLTNVVIQLVLTWYLRDQPLYEAVSWLVMCLLVQGTLVSLFLYPLWKLNGERKRYLQSNASQSRMTHVDNVTNLIRRCLIITSVYFFTDLSFVAVIVTNAVRGTGLPRPLMFLLQDINSLTNLTCMLISFHNWKTIFVPWKKLSWMRKQTVMRTRVWSVRGESSLKQTSSGSLRKSDSGGNNKHAGQL